MVNDNTISFDRVKKTVEEERELNKNIKIYRDDIIHDINVMCSTGAVKEDKRNDWRAFLLKSLKKFQDSGIVDIEFLDLKACLLNCLVSLVEPNVEVAYVVSSLRSLCRDDGKYREILNLVVEYSPRGKELESFLATYGVYGNLLPVSFAR